MTKLMSRDMLMLPWQKVALVDAPNGRTRQPADLWTPNLNLPMRGSLLLAGCRLLDGLKRQRRAYFQERLWRRP
jgi:hypothetical protein